MSQEVIENFLCESIEGFRSYKTLAERAIEQVSDEEFFRAIDAEANSLATICKHIGGNLRSRWTRFLTTDGEKADRNRDSEFVTNGDTRQSIMKVIKPTDISYKICLLKTNLLYEHRSTPIFIIKPLI